MSVYKDEKTGTWRTVFRYKDWTGKVVQKQKRGFKTRREAVQWEADYLSRVAGDLEMKMKDFVQIYKEERFIRLKAVTVDQKNNVISTKILPYFGEMSLNSITSKDVIKWQNKLLAYRDSEGKPYSQSYLKKLHAELSAIFNYAKRYYNLQTNPAANAGSFGSENDIQMDFWTTEEYMKFSEEIMYDPPYYYFYEILYWLGLREGEALALTKDDFDFDNKTVSVSKTFQIVNREHLITPPKTPKSNRKVKIPDFLCDEISEYFETLPEDFPNDERIFYMLSKSSVNKKLSSIAKKQE